jgi:hypothetical protein
VQRAFVSTVAISVGLPIFAGLAQSAGSCPAGFQLVYDLNEYCIASFKGACPPGSTMFTMDGRPLCLYGRSPESKASVSLPKSEQSQPALQGEKEMSSPDPPRLAPDSN